MCRPQYAWERSEVFYNRVVAYARPPTEACGNSTVERQLWEGVTGVVNEVIAPTAIRIFVSEPAPHVLTIKLVGVRSPAGRKAAKKEKC